MKKHPRKNDWHIYDENEEAKREEQLKSAQYLFRNYGISNPIIIESIFEEVTDAKDNEQ